MIRVLVVDDSASVRDLLVRLLRADGRFEIAGTAADGEEAVLMTARLRPDVITMDVHMPRLDGLAAIRRIMADTPTPIVVISASIRERDVGLALEALQAGAVTVLEKPHGPGDPRHATAARDLVTTIRLMSEVRVVRRSVTDARSGDNGTSRLLAEPMRLHGPRPLAVALVASTGGPQAIQTVLQTVGGGLDVPVLIVQHISRGFMAGMAAWLSSTCPQPVKLAEYGEEPRGGTVYLAPQDHHLMLARSGTLILSSAPPMRGFRPSANVLFECLVSSDQNRAEHLQLPLTDRPWGRLSKPVWPEELLHRVKAVLGDGGFLPGSSSVTQLVSSARRSPQGQVIAVISNKGGVGKSTIAVNLAVGLRRLYGDRVLGA